MHHNFSLWRNFTTAGNFTHNVNFTFATAKTSLPSHLSPFTTSLLAKLHSQCGLLFSLPLAFAYQKPVFPKNLLIFRKIPPRSVQIFGQFLSPSFLCLPSVWRTNSRHKQYSILGVSALRYQGKGIHYVLRFARIFQ